MNLRALSSVPEEAEPEGGAGQPTPAQVVEQTRQEYEQIQKELKEIGILINQSMAEVEKLAQRNAQLATKVRTVEQNLDTVPRQDIKEVYTAAQEAQMRLFMMRGQVEQLQSRQDNLRRFSESLQQILEVAGSLVGGADGGAGPVNPTGEGDFSAESSGIVKIINAQEIERQRLANQLHDGPAQSLTNLILQAEIVERLFDNNPGQARSELSELKGAVTNTFQKVREFIFDLRPMMLDDLGLNPTLKKSLEDYEQKTGIACNLTISGKDTRLPPHSEVTIFRVTQQLLKNVRDHAQATHVQIMMDVGHDQVKVSVEDDGIGFDVPEALAASRERKTIGLSSIQEQIQMLGGEIKLDSAPGKGSRIDFSIPL